MDVFHIPPYSLECIYKYEQWKNAHQIEGRAGNLTLGRRPCPAAFPASLLSRFVLFIGWFRRVGWVVSEEPEKGCTPPVVVLVLASVGGYMREIADLASSRWLEPHPN